MKNLYNNQIGYTKTGEEVKSAKHKHQCRGDGPLSTSVHMQSQGRGGRGGRDGNNATWGAVDNDGSLGG
jgi:hypothetical protein